MKNNLLSISMLLMLGVLFSFCKKTKPDPCENKVCGENAVCNQGVCECVANSYKVGGGCMEKSPNTYYFTGLGCNTIPSEFTLKVTQDAKDPSLCYFNYVFPLIVVGGAPNFYGGGSDGDYYKRTDGDSIRTIGIFKDAVIKGKVCTNEVTGRYVGTNRLDLTVRFFEISNYATTLDKCKITMKK